jgi:hypothetical protein
MTNCDEIREHLEACEECRLHISVEARLRTQPVLDPPKGLVARVLRALPRAAPLRREILRLVAAAAILVALAAGAIFFRPDQSPAYVTDVKPHLTQAWQAVASLVTTLNPLERSE